MSTETVTTTKYTQTSPDNVVTLDISSISNLQIGYQAETIFLKASEDDSLVIKEYINGLSGSEYYAKVTSNRFKTTVRYGRREEVNPNTYVEVFLPKTWHGELQLSSLYGHITTEEDWEFERFAAEATEGSITFKTIKAPRIRINTSVSPVHIEKTIGFTDIHSVSGPIVVDSISGGAKLETSSSPIFAAFETTDNVIESETLNGAMELVLPQGCGLKVDGVSKRGNITTDIEGLEIKVKPGNVHTVTGILGEKPFQNVRLSSINGDIMLHY